MRTYLITILVLTSLFLATPLIKQAHAEKVPDFSALTMTGESFIDQVIDPLRLRTKDGRILQLAGIDIPDLTPYDTGDIGMAALDYLRKNMAQKTVKVYQNKDPRKRQNRMGYELVYIIEKNSGAWAQGALLEKGLARLRPSSVDIEMAPPMLVLEEQARNSQAGFWAEPAYAVLTPENATQGMNGWAIVEGIVRASAMANNTVYLNFGHDWRSDFTIGIPSSVRREMTNAGLNPQQLAHQHVRVHGWIESYNGPYIELLHPVWIEILPDPSQMTNLGESH